MPRMMHERKLVEAVKASAASLKGPTEVFEIVRTFEYLLARMIKRANKIVRVNKRQF
jgi:hypothetical protein